MPMERHKMNSFIVFLYSQYSHLKYIVNYRMHHSSGHSQTSEKLPREYRNIKIQKPRKVQTENFHVIAET